MISTVLYGIGIIFIILAAAAFLGLFHLAGAGAGALLVVGIIAVVVAYLLAGRARGRV